MLHMSSNGHIEIPKPSTGRSHVKPQVILCVIQPYLTFATKLDRFCLAWVLNADPVEGDAQLPPGQAVARGVRQQECCLQRRQSRGR